MLKSETNIKSRIFDSDDFIGDIINRSIGAASQIRNSPISTQFQREDKTSSSLVPNNSVEDFGNKMAAKVNKIGEGPINLLSKGATVQCINCGNMAKNLAYLENYIKTNGSKKATCSTCSTALSFLEYLNKNIENVFSNISSASLCVLEQHTNIHPKSTNEINSLSASKRTLKKSPKGTRSSKTSSQISKPKGMESQITTISSTAKNTGKGLKGLKKLKPKIKKNTSQMNEGGVNESKLRVRKLKKRTKPLTKLATKSQQSNVQQ